MISTTYYVSGYDAFDYGFSSYPLKYSSTFSLPSNTQSYSFNWSANSNLNVTYNNVNQTGTSGTFTGSLSTMSVSFAFDIGSTNAPSSYILTYHVFATIATIESHTYSEQSYTYSISQNGNYFNSTYLYFNYSVPSGASSSYSISYELKIGNLTLTNPAAPSEYFALPSNTFTYSSVSRYGNTINITAYQNYTSAQSAPVKFDTSEIVNYYPTINYVAVRWTGTGSKAELTVNATTTGGGYTFPSETIQILNINWGDGSTLQTSSTQGGSYNWTLVHNYTESGSFSVSFQVVNWIGSSYSLSTSKTLTYGISVGITNYPLDGAVIVPTETIYFNWTNTNAGITSLSLTIDSILQESKTYSSLSAGSLGYSVTYLGSLSVSWHWAAGNITGYTNLTYVTQDAAEQPNVLMNFTYKGILYSNYVPFVNSYRYNATWSYWWWTIYTPSSSYIDSIKAGSNWIFEYASPQLYVYYSGNSTLHFFMNTTVYQAEWLAPNPPQDAYFIINLEDAAGNTIGASGASVENFNVFVNGTPQGTDVVDATTGHTYNIKVYSEPFNTLISSSNFTVNYPVSEDIIKLAVYPLAIQNLNQSHYALFTVEQNGQSLPIQFIGLGAEKDFSIVAGTYYFNFTQYSLGNVAGATISRLTTISGPSIQFISGTTLAQISSEQKNISTQINNVNITFYAGNSKLYNETLRINASIVNTNSSIVKQVLDENTTINNIYSKVQSINSAVYAIQNNIMSDINSTRVNVTTKETTIKDLVSLSLQEENSTFSYQLKFGTPSVQGETYKFPVFVTLFNGQMANLSVTQQAWQNLKLYYVTGNSTFPLNYSVSAIQPGSFVMTIYNVTPTMAAGITANQALITAQGKVKEGVLTNLAAGIIGSQQIQYSSQNIWTEIFGISPPNENNSAVGVLAYLSWLQESYAGRAIYLLVVFSILAYYAIAIDLKLKERERKKNSKGGDDAKSNAR